MEAETPRTEIYEIAFLARSADAEGGVLKVFAREGGTVVRRSEPVSLTLAYPIAHERSAFLGVILLSAERARMKSIRSALALERGILRFLIVRVPEAREAKVPSARPPFETKPPVRPQVLSNEALEEKLEEILK